MGCVVVLFFELFRGYREIRRLVCSFGDVKGRKGWDVLGYGWDCVFLNVSRR